MEEPFLSAGKLPLTGVMSMQSDSISIVRNRKMLSKFYVLLWIMIL
jgi:hypothetical protein